MAGVMKKTKSAAREVRRLEKRQIKEQRQRQRDKAKEAKPGDTGLVSCPLCHPVRKDL
jgi:hypothetical protein